MTKIKLPQRLIKTTILMVLVLFLIIGMIVEMIVEKGQIQSALNLSQQNRDQLLKSESVTESLLIVESRFKEYCTTFEAKVFEEYKTQGQTLVENIRLLQETVSQEPSEKDNCINKIFKEKTKEADIYVRLKQITDSLMFSVSSLEEHRIEIEGGSGGRVDTLSVTETREKYKKGLFGKIKSAIVGEKIRSNVKTKIRVQTPDNTIQTNNQKSIPFNINKLVKKNFELKESELKLMHINNSLILEIRKLIDEIKSNIKDQEAEHNNSFLLSVRHSTGIIQCILIVLMILACILAGYILFLAYRNDKFQDHIITLSQKVMNDSIEKDKFYSIISHDLMNPFNALLGFSELLKESAKRGDDKNFVEYSSAVHMSAKRIFNLLQNLLIWSRLQNGKMEYSPKSVKIDELVSDAMMVMLPIAQNKEINLAWDTQGDITAKIDANMISSALQNLVTNAIKFTEKGGEVKVSVFVESGNLNFSVSDTGVGMDETKLQKLFSLDKTASSRGTDNEVGTGLGLIISKEFIELHQGQIWAESVLGKGSDFHFSIPLS
jgi:signal transduction histidine kinase